MSDNVQEEKVQSTCYLGYIDFTKTNTSYTGTYAHTSPVSSQERNIPEQYYRQSDFTESTNLSHVRQSNGGVLPKINYGIGAPRCTFVYGGIVPGEVSPFAKYIQGPEYNPIFSDGEYKIGSVLTGTVTEDIGTSGYYNIGNTPTIPVNDLSSKYETGGATPSVLTTYNIWELGNLDNHKDAYSLVKNKGYVFDKNASSNYHGPWMYQHFNNDTVYTCVVAPEGHPATVSRIFPLSKDIVYQPECKLYYPATDIGPNLLNLSPLQGNCGFHLHFLHDEIKEQTSQTENAGITIRWGTDISKQPSYLSKIIDKIEDFVLYIYPHKSPQLFYWDPWSRIYKSIELNGPSFSNSNIFDVYVHFVGTEMLIGFNEDPVDWNVFFPVSDPNNLNNYAYPQISKDANIAMIINNMTVHFQYSPIAFNNFNVDKNYYSNIGKDTDYYNKYKTGFKNIPESSDDKGVTTVASLSKILKDNAYLNKTFHGNEKVNNNFSDESDRPSGPTYYADWRRIQGLESGQNYNDQLIFEQQTNKNPNIPDDPNSPQKTQINNYISWNTTIEGPMFLLLADDPGSKDNNNKPIIEANKWNVSRYLSTWNVTYKGELENNSFIQGDATVTLKDLALTDEGRDFLALLEENTLLLTLEAGYDKNYRFFQGLVNNTTTTYTSAGSITSIKCSDIGTRLLNETVAKDVYIFTFARFIDVIKVCLEQAGFPKTSYDLDESPFNEINDTKLFKNYNNLWNEAIKQRIGSGMTFYSSISTKLLGLSPLSGLSIMETLKFILESIFAKHIFPAMYWDCNKQILKLTARQSDSDTLYFYGNTSKDIPLPSKRHGIVQGQYEILTNNQTQFAGHLFWANTATSLVIQESSDYITGESGISPSVYPTINNPYQQNHGWVGFKKVHVENLNNKWVQNRKTLKGYTDYYEASRLTYPYNNIKLTVYITEPLKHWSQFAITTFTPGEVTHITDFYGYESVTYKFEKDANKLVAEIAGENFPRPSI